MNEDERPAVKTRQDRIDAWLDKAGRVFFYGVFAVAPALLALAILGLQIFTFLYDGRWVPMSFADMLGIVGWDWARNPTSWLGAHKIIDYIPAPLGLLGISGFFIFAAEAQ